MGLSDELISQLDNERVSAVWTELINWQEFWAREHSVEDWIAWPLIPKGRQVALFAPAKSAKSYLTLAVVAAVATGRDVLGQRNHNGPQHVLYLDYEMTEDDLHERLEELGYGPDDDLSHLHYALLPSLPPLNTDEGATAVLGLASAVSAVVVVVDTTGRAIWGEENSNDSYRDFAQTTGYILKQAGIAVLRTDHAGKDATKGQRGASAKNDDVDVVMRVEAVEDGLVLTRTHTRIGWVPPRVQIQRKVVGDVTTYVADNTTRPYVSGTRELVADLKALGIDANSSRRTAADSLRGAGEKVSNKRISDALRWMREEAPTFPFNPVDNHPPSNGDHSGTTRLSTGGDQGADHSDKMPSDQGGDHSGTNGDQGFGQLGTSGPPYTGATSPSPDLQPTPEPPPEQTEIDYDAAGL